MNICSSFICKRTEEKLLLDTNSFRKSYSTITQTMLPYVEMRKNETLWGKSNCSRFPLLIHTKQITGMSTSIQCCDQFLFKSIISFMGIGTEYFGTMCNKHS